MTNTEIYQRKIQNVSYASTLMLRVAVDEGNTHPYNGIKYRLPNSFRLISLSLGGKNHLFLLDITAGIRAPEMRVFPFKAIAAAHVQYQCIYFAALVNGAVRLAVSERSGNLT